jgi:Mn-dependent DtxR family transcriptional regulator
VTDDHSERLADELGREVPAHEVTLLREALIRHENGPYATIRTAHIAAQAGVHDQTARQIVRTWGNDGAVQLVDNNGETFSLTEFGQRLARPLVED